jgi:ribosomal protein L25 (general stress protein Ctc)
MFSHEKSSDVNFHIKTKTNRKIFEAKEATTVIPIIVDIIETRKQTPNHAHRTHWR